MVKSGSMVTGCADRPEHRMQISHRDATLRPNLSPKLHARQPKLVYSELFRASLVKSWTVDLEHIPYICADGKFLALQLKL